MFSVHGPIPGSLGNFIARSRASAVNQFVDRRLAQFRIRRVRHAP